jgi:demethylmenaquinone methyltransferase/2-methoxy-6-polyprenyl-1,4-benzoquinol methylase
MTTLLKRVERVSVDAIDFSAGVCAKAQAAADCHGWTEVNIRQNDVLAMLGEPRYERIAVTFGLKTLDDGQLKKFAAVLVGLLCAGGRAALVEIQIPRARLLRGPYLAYLRWVIPMIGRLFQGDADCCRSLAIYMEDFAWRDQFASNLREVGLAVRAQLLFFGCARLYIADKPRPD